MVSLFVSGVNLIGHESELRHQIENGIQTIVDNVRPHNATEDAETLNVNDWAR